MADNEVNAKLTADTDEAVKDVDDLGDSFDRTADKADDAGDEIATFGDRMSKMGDKLTGVGTALSVGLTAPIVGVAGAAINLGLEAVEAESLFETSFGGMAEQARAWSEETSDALGLNEFELRRQSATLFTMTESMGLSREASFDMAKGITTLAGDMASFFNSSPEEAFNKLRSGITGEAEPLKQLGILVSENFVKQTDFAQAILATGRELTEQEKVQARYIAILEQTSTAQGDLARTAESPANRIRRMGSEIKEAGTKLGLALIPVVERVLPLFEKLVSMVEKVVDRFSKMSPAGQNVVIALVGMLAAAGPVLIIAGKLVTAWGAVATAMTGFAAPAATAAASTTTTVGIMGKLATLLPTVTGGITAAGAATAAGTAAVVGLTVAAGAFIGVGIGSALNQAAIESRGYADATDQAIEKVGLFKAGLSLLPDLFNSLKNAGVAVFEGFVALPGLFLDWLSSTSLVTGAQELLTSALEALGPVGDFVMGVASALGDAWDTFFSFFGDGVAFIQTKIQEFGEALFAFGDAAQPALDPIGNATKEQTEALNDFIAKQNEATAGANELATAETAAGAATAESAAAAKKAASAREAEARATKALADQLGTAGLAASMEKTNKAMEELNKRGERLGSDGLDKVIKQVQKLKAEGVPLTGSLKAWDDRVKAAAANLPPLSAAIEDIPIPELTDAMIDADLAAMDFGDTAGVTGASLASLGDDMTDAERAAIGLPPKIQEGTDAAELMSRVLMDTANAMSIFGISADSTVGQLVGLASGFTAAIPAITDYNKSILGGSGTTAEKFAGAASGIASGISAVASATSSGGAGASAAKGALAGAQAGAQIGGPIGAGVGAAAGAIVGFFRGRGRDKIRKAVSDAVGADVSEDLSQSIKDAAKEAGNDIQTQSLLSLGDIFRDVGVEEFRDGAMGAANAVTDLMKGVADGSIDAKDGVAAIGDAFTELAGQTFEAGKVADAGLIQLVKNSRELGQEVPEIAAFVESQLAQAAQGISKVIGGIQIADPQDAQDQAAIFAGAFFATVEEVGLLEAVDAFGPAFEELKSQLQELGIEGTDFGGVGRLFEIAGKEEFRPLLEGVQGLDEALVGMANSGFLTADSFSAFQRQGESAFEQLQAAGLSQNESLQQMAPFLQSAIDAAERFGIPLDANTQELIRQAEAAGIAFETDPMNRMADAMVLVAELLGATEEQMASLGNTAATTGDQMATSLGGAAEAGSAAFAGMATTSQEASREVAEQMSGDFDDLRSRIEERAESGGSLINSFFPPEEARAALAEVEEAVANFDLAALTEQAEGGGILGDLAQQALEQLPLVKEQLDGLAAGAVDATAAVGENIAGLPDVAAESVGGIAESFAEGSTAITEGLDPIAEKMASEILDAGEQTSTAIDASFASTNEAIKSGLGEVSSTFVGEVAPAALAAAAATEKIASAAREAAKAAASIEFPSGPDGGGADASAAAGMRGVLGRDTLIQAHRGEFVNIIPEDQTRRMDFASAQNGMGPGISAERMGTVNMGDTTLVFQGSGNRREDDNTISKLIKELAASDGQKRAQLQRMLGVRT